MSEVQETLNELGSKTTHFGKEREEAIFVIGQLVGRIPFVDGTLGKRTIFKVKD